VKVNLIFKSSVTLCEDGNRYFPECCVRVVCCDVAALLIANAGPDSDPCSATVRVIVQKKRQIFWVINISLDEKIKWSIL